MARSHGQRSNLSFGQKLLRGVYFELVEGLAMTLPRSFLDSFLRLKVRSYVVLLGTLFVPMEGKGACSVHILRRPDLLLCVIIAVAFVLWLHNDVAVSDSASKAEAVAEKVEKKSEQTEKAEGKNDLVKDEVKVKTDAKGKPVVEQVGEASWYGKGFQGKKTASGETFDQHDRTAAHPTLPLGTEATVTNLENGKSVEVEINDRGPYTKGRDIDLSKEAAQEIGIKKDGAAPVKIEAKVPPEEKEKNTK